MSDLVRHTDIEDVLTSVRRLVANVEDEAPSVLQSNHVSPKSEEGALVLTPALRVSPAGEGLEQSGATDPETAIPETKVDNALPFRLSKRAAEAVSEGRWDGASLEERIAELEAAVSKTEQDWEPDGSETAPPPETFDEMETGDLIKRPDPFAAEWTPEIVANNSEPVDEVLMLQAEDVQAPEPAEALEEAPEEADQAPVALDDEALRGLVMSILNEELQGALGDRISREIQTLIAQGGSAAPAKD